MRGCGRGRRLRSSLPRENKPDAVHTLLKSAHDLAHFADFTYLGMGVAVFNIDARLRLDTFSGVVIVVRNVTRAIFNEVILRVETGTCDAFASRRQKIACSEAGMSRSMALNRRRPVKRRLRSFRIGSAERCHCFTWKNDV